MTSISIPICELQDWWLDYHDLVLVGQHKQSGSPITSQAVAVVAVQGCSLILEAHQSPKGDMSPPKRAIQDSWIDLFFVLKGVRSNRSTAGIGTR